MWRKTLHHNSAIYIMVDMKTSPWVYHLFQTCKTVYLALHILSRLVLTHFMDFRGFEDEHQSRYCAPIVSFVHFCRYGASLPSRVQWPLLQRVEFVSFNSFMIAIRQSKNVKFDIISPGLAWLLLRCECVPVIQVIFHSDSAWLVIWTGDSPWNIQLAIRSYVPETQIVLLSKW